MQVTSSDMNMFTFVKVKVKVLCKPTMALQKNNLGCSKILKMSESEHEREEIICSESERRVWVRMK